MYEQLDRVESMMCIGTIITDEKGKSREDKETSAAVRENYADSSTDGV